MCGGSVEDKGAFNPCTFVTRGPTRPGEAGAGCVHVEGRRGVRRGGQQPGRNPVRRDP